MGNTIYERHECANCGSDDVYIKVGNRIIIENNTPKNKKTERELILRQLFVLRQDMEYIKQMVGVFMQEREKE